LLNATRLAPLPRRAEPQYPAEALRAAADTRHYDSN
jgi:hypothetical protein